MTSKYNLDIKFTMKNWLAAGTQGIYEFKWLLHQKKNYQFKWPT